LFHNKDHKSKKLGRLETTEKTNRRNQDVTSKIRLRLVADVGCVQEIFFARSRLAIKEVV
jgi:hypothetical protein